MIQLHDIETGQPLGAITEVQLQFLIDQMEEESPQDQDYYLNRDTVDRFEENAADPNLISLLRTALADREEMEFRWARE